MSSDLFCMIQWWFCRPGISDEVNNLFYWSDVIFMSFKTQGPWSLNDWKSLPINPLWKLRCVLKGGGFFFSVDHLWFSANLGGDTQFSNLLSLESPCRFLFWLWRYLIVCFFKNNRLLCVLKLLHHFMMMIGPSMFC